MAPKLPVIERTGLGAMVDAELLARARVISWGAWKGKFNKLLSEFSDTITIGGKECYQWYYHFDGNISQSAGGTAERKWLRLLGQSDDDIDGMYEAYRNSSVEHVTLEWRDFQLGFTESTINRIYTQIKEQVETLGIAKAKISGVTDVYPGATPVEDRTGSEPTKEGMHDECAYGLNNSTALLGCDGAMVDWNIVFEDTLGTAIVINDETLNKAIQALLLLDREEVATVLGWSKTGESINGSGDWDVTSEVTFDMTAMNEMPDLSGYVFGEDQSLYSTDSSPWSEIVPAYQNIFKNFLWRYIGDMSPEAGLEFRSEGIFTEHDGNAYLVIEELEKASQKQMEQMVIPAIQIRLRMHSKTWYQVVAEGLAAAIEKILGGIFDLMMYDPVFRGMQSLLVMGMTEALGMSKQDARYWARRATIEAMKIATVMAINAASAGATVPADTALLADSTTLAVQDTVWTAEAAAMTSQGEAMISETMLSAIDMGVQAVSGYIGVQDQLRQFQSAEQNKQLEELREQLLAEKQEQQTTVILGTMGDYDSFEEMNNQLYSELFDQKADDPFGPNGEFDKFN